MAGESKGDNKLFQIIMVVITSIVAPTSVYFLTHLPNTSPNPTATLPATSAQLSSVAGVAITASPDQSLFTPTVLPTEVASLTPTVDQFTLTPTETSSFTPTMDQSTFTPTVTPTETSSFTPTAAKLPLTPTLPGILPAGEPGIVGGFAVEMLSKEIQVKDGVTSIQIHVRNLNSQTQTFTYSVQSIIVKDAGGRAMEVIYGEKRDACSKKDLSTKKKLVLAPDQEIILQSVEERNDVTWCASNDGLLLPLYKAFSKEAPKWIEIEFNSFGPFTDFGFKIDF